MQYVSQVWCCRLPAMRHGCRCRRQKGHSRHCRKEELQDLLGYLLLCTSRRQPAATGNCGLNWIGLTGGWGFAQPHSNLARPLSAVHLPDQRASFLGYQLATPPKKFCSLKFVIIPSINYFNSPTLNSIIGWCVCPPNDRITV